MEVVAAVVPTDDVQQALTLTLLEVQPHIRPQTAHQLLIALIPLIGCDHLLTYDVLPVFGVLLSALVGTVLRLSSSGFVGEVAEEGEDLVARPHVEVVGGGVMRYGLPVFLYT